MSVETIPLSKLSAWKGNVRKTAITEGLDELKASIRAQGLLTPLIVQKGDKGERRVIDGQRRLLALRALHKEGHIPADHSIDCVIMSSEADALEVGLTANVVRSQMHPADQIEAFRDLIDKGSSIADVAARFGVSETVVTKRLKLGRVSPKLLDEYRKGEMTLAQVEALTLTDDHVVQETVWNDARGWQRQPQSLREALTKGEVSATDNRVKFIGGIEAYEAAGGKVRRDLFDAQNAGYITDLTLLNQLVVNKLDEIAAGVRAEGRKWVEIMPTLDWDAVRKFGQVYPATAELTPEQEEQLSSLSAELEKLEAVAEEGELTDEQEARSDEINAAIEALESRQQVYRSEDISRAGAFVSVGYRGETEIRCGYVKPEDKETPVARAGTSAALAPEEKGIPASLVEDITAQRTAALRVELAKRPHIALAETVYTLARSRSPFGLHDSSLKLSLSGFNIEALIQQRDCLALQAYAATDRLTEALPTDEMALWDHLLRQPDEFLLELLAELVSHGIDAIDFKSGSKAPAHARQLAAAISLDMKTHFVPTAENYFSRLPKAELIKALIEMDGGEPVSPATEKMKKGELAAMAERTFEATGRKWLPEPLRSTTPSVESEGEHGEPEELNEAA